MDGARIIDVCAAAAAARSARPESVSGEAPRAKSTSPSMATTPSAKGVRSGDGDVVRRPRRRMTRGAIPVGLRIVRIARYHATSLAKAMSRPAMYTVRSSESASSIPSITPASSAATSS